MAMIPNDFLSNKSLRERTANTFYEGQESACGRLTDVIKLVPCQKIPGTPFWQNKSACGMLAGFKNLIIAPGLETKKACSRLTTSTKSLQYH